MAGPHPSFSGEAEPGGEAEPPRGGPPGRATRTLGPVVAGLLLDAADFATFGPIGLSVGFFVGALAGWLLAPSLGIPPRGRWLAAFGSGVYCMLPFTAFLPLATVLGVLVRLHEQSQPASAGSAPSQSRNPPIEAEYRASWDDDSASR